MRNGLLVTAVDAKNGTGTGASCTAPDGGDAGNDLARRRGLEQPERLVVGPNNNIYFTDGQYQVCGVQGTTGVYRISGDGGVQAIQQNFGRANGIAISQDNTKLYVGVGP